MIKRFCLRVFYGTEIGTILQRIEWRREHSAKYRIRKINKGLSSGEQNRGILFDNYYSEQAVSSQNGYEYHFDYPDTNDAITKYFTSRGYEVEKSRFGRNLFIYKP